MPFARIKLVGYLWLLVSSVAAGSMAFGQNGGSSREPFVLELPGVSQDRYVLPTVRTGSNDLPALRIRVLSPFAEKIKYGSIIVTLNGEGINRECSKTRDMEGKVVSCRRRGEDSLGYQIVPGKNILELEATDDDGREFYASYVLILGAQTASRSNIPSADLPVQRFAGRKFAIIVGVSDYQYNDAGLRSLDFADDDARAVAEFLRTKEGGGFLPADIKLMIDRDASLVALRSALSETARRAGPEDMVFIFIAGHGAPDPYAAQNLYFLFHDTKVADMERTAFPMSELKIYLDAKLLAKRVIVAIDTCHSAGVNQKTRSMVSGRKLVQTGDENNITNFYLAKNLFRDKGRSILTSSDVDETSQESAKWDDHGVFTWALLKGLKGNADSNNDKLITVGELFRYVRSTVQAATKHEQNPIALTDPATNMVVAMVGSGK